ncbi:hypothetical protein C5I05_14275 [Salmonella enterica subsp. enterica serovar Copenhagen]|nr:hypothetical protein C5I03_14285 [Salmonella enterica subsp. enterica serovar Typhimurium]PTC60963.1 hypothetical protein C5I05_14275 [Salmonella enterica subsp. enterica serovar Copenhagen]PTC71337.1 hypothetical protein C5I00_14285 [Salmonella enterica subsp. enterica serovar Copenhagen]PTC74378.1 hypothetical protein C5H97_14290 [Salmonella enterica subsp. enterica serovar Copenhagen]PTC86835.1 hypothetical protein C5H96_14270 [Salmonella enterica subsp. enterica serovar Copenhagen]
MNTVLIPPGPGGYGKGLWLPVASGKKVLSLTGREIHPVAIEIGALTESEVVNGFSDIPPDNDILCVVINCAGSLRCGLYPQKGIPTINVLPTWRAGPLAQFISNGVASGFGIDPINDFVRAVRHKAPYPVTAEDGLAVSRICEAVHRSLESGKPEDV